MIQNNRKINIITLGCSKNVVDSEHLMQQLKVGGWEVLHDSNDPTAKVVVVNTCGFIADAKEESVNTILNLLNAKKQGILSKVFVMGCLSQRYREELEVELPDVDGFFGVSDLPLILEELSTPLSHQHINRRMLTTPSHYAYLKISEGCSWGCSFCAIPLIRGKHQSKPIPELVDQAQSLASMGVKELILIAQDSTFYGKDYYGERKLPELVSELTKVNGLEWIRIHYAYPTGFPDGILPLMRENPKVCQYLDIPFQHISNRILKAMRRGITKEETYALIERIRSEVPGVAIRTTLLVGHPGETREDFAELVDFVERVKFERLGVFTYSPEEGTHSASLPDDVPDDIKAERMERIMELQRDISAQHNQKRIGQTQSVIIDRVEGNHLVGRTEFDSPEVDQEVTIVKPEGSNIKIGDIIACKIQNADDYDLEGMVV